MTMIPAEPQARDFAIEAFLADWARGQCDAADGAAMLAELRRAGDVRRLERLSRALAEGAPRH